MPEGTPEPPEPSAQTDLERPGAASGAADSGESAAVANGELDASALADRGDLADGATSANGATSADGESHRGAFGDFGATSDGLIDRTFRERIVLVGVTLAPHTDEQTERSLDELALLVDTAGADVVDRITQHRGSPDSATYLGSGKVAELKEVCVAHDVDTVVFDDELTPAQQRNLEKALGRTAIDRTAVILDIFAQNASSVEGKAQVELAQLRYLAPRLRGRGSSLSQQAGGLQGGGIIGTRGPGETKLEIDRRRLQRRVHKLEADLREVGKVRDNQAKARRRSRLHLVTIVGYTNAGKSTLLNCLTDAGVLVEDRLFATLDAATRRLHLPGGETVLLSDTVGFITKLPHQLVEAFKTTLEVAIDAELLVHVVDGSGPNPVADIHAVDDVLAEIGAGEVPQLLVVNKADLDRPAAERLAGGHRGSVVVSARTGDGIDDLLQAISEHLRARTTTEELCIPYDRGDVLAALHREGEVLSEQATDAGMVVQVRLDDDAAGRLREFSSSAGA